MATILIIDDQKVSREPVVALLGRHDHLLLVALDGEEALDIVRVNKPDMVLADVLMPDMDGYQFLMRLRAEPNGARLPVVFRASAHVEVEARELMRDCGVSHFVSKSAEPEM